MHFLMSTRDSIDHGIDLVLVVEGTLKFSVEVAGDEEEQERKKEDDGEKDQNCDC